MLPAQGRHVIQFLFAEVVVVDVMHVEAFSTSAYPALVAVADQCGLADGLPMIVIGMFVGRSGGYWFH